MLPWCCTRDFIAKWVPETARTLHLIANHGWFWLTLSFVLACRISSMDDDDFHLGLGAGKSCQILLRDITGTKTRYWRWVPAAPSPAQRQYQLLRNLPSFSFESQTRWVRDTQIVGSSMNVDNHSWSWGAANRNQESSMHGNWNPIGNQGWMQSPRGRFGFWEEAKRYEGMTYWSEGAWLSCLLQRVS